MANPIVLSERDIVRFWSKVRKIEGDGCWEWTASQFSSGYGMFQMTNIHKPVMAHRVASTIMFGAIPDGMFVLHSCDNPKCVRHLRLGSQSENQRERYRKGRHKVTHAPVLRKHRVPLEARFWEKVDKSNECWLWRASTKTNGYGQFVVDGRARQAHRVAYTLTTGSIPNDKEVCHTCDNRSCVRPSHLFLSTRSGNMQDCLRKGRYGSAKLSPDDVRVLRTLSVEKPELSYTELGHIYGITRTETSNIIRRKTWTHI